MTKKLSFKVVVTDGTKELISKDLSYEMVANLVSNFSDNDSNHDFFSIAAKHPASTVRENVAYKDSLSQEAYDTLADDTSISVLRNLVRSGYFKENAPAELLEKFVKLDHEIAQSIAGDIDSYQNANANSLMAMLLESSDPSVAASLASNYNTPKKILKSLVNHSDPYVASEAKSRLED